MWWNNLRQYRKPWTPWQLPGAKVVLLSDRGVATVDASIQSPNDLTGSGWGAGSGTTRGVNTLTDIAGSGLHYTTLTPPNLVISHPMTLTFEAKAGTIGFMWVGSGGYVFVTYLNLATGASAATVGGVCSSVALQDSWFRYTFNIQSTASSGASIYFGMCTEFGTPNYVASGTGTIQLRNVQVAQKNVNAWVSQHTNVSLVQATLTSRPTLTDSDPNYGGKPSINCIGNGFLQSITMPNVAGPFTVYVLAKQSSSTAQKGVFSLSTDTVGVPCMYIQSGSPPTSLVGSISNSAGTKSLGLCNANTNVFGFLIDGLNSRVSFGSTLGALGTLPDASIANCFTIGGLYTGAGSANNYFNGSYSAMLVFAAAHDLPTRNRVMNWLRVWAGNSFTL
jgi:hypothetical protein